MDNITIIEGDDLDLFLASVEATDPYRIRIWQSPDGSGIKIKINERMWTPSLGKKDE